MVKTKSKKPSKSKKQAHIKRSGKQASTSKFRAQLDALGLQIIQMNPDGNCLFRAIADQLEGNEDNHTKYRRMVVQFIMKNREMFEPFIEDNKPFDEYVQSMDKDGIWAGYKELYAASLVTHTNICIHEKDSPRSFIRNFDNREARMIHLSFHDDHYNSVRSKKETCTGRATSIIIKSDAGLSGKSNKKKGKSNKKKAAVSNAKSATGCCNDNQNDEAEQHIKKTGKDTKFQHVGTGCNDDNQNDEAEQQHIKKTCKDTKFQHVGSGCCDDNQNDEAEQHIKKTGKNTKSQHVGTGCGDDNQNDEAEQHIKKTGKDTKFQHVGKQKNIPRNKICPCGSRKNYKSCCGTVQGTKDAASSNISDSHSLDKVTPDFDALRL